MLLLLTVAYTQSREMQEYEREDLFLFDLLLAMKK